MDGQDYVFMALLTIFIRNYHSFHRLPPPHIFSGLLHFYLGTTNPTQSVRPQDTPPIWMDKALSLYGFINKISLFTNSTAPTHILDTPPLLLRHNTQPSLFDHRAHLLYGWYVFMALLTIFHGNYHSFHQLHRFHRPHTHSRDSSILTEVQRTQPSQFDHRTHTLNGLNLAQLSRHLLLDKWDNKLHPSHYTHVPFSICTWLHFCMYGEKITWKSFLMVQTARCIILHWKAAVCFYMKINPVHTNSPLSSSSEQLKEWRPSSQHSPSSWVPVVQSAVAMVPFTIERMW